MTWKSRRFQQRNVENVKVNSLYVEMTSSLTWINENMNVCSTRNWIRRWFLPVAQRLPLGFTLIFATLFLSSVKSKLTAPVKDTKENKTTNVNKPHWQRLLIVNPLISTRSGELSSRAQISKCLLLAVVSGVSSCFYILSWPGWALFTLRVL